MKLARLGLVFFINDGNIVNATDGCAISNQSL